MTNENVATVVDRCIRSRTWLSECTKELRSYTKAGSERKEAEKYAAEKYKAAGALWNGRWP
jgi:hypothetical protein